MKKNTKKILAILSIIVLLLTNYSFVVEAVNMSYPMTGGSNLSNLGATQFNANSSEKVYYLNGDYNAQSLVAGYSNIDVYSYDLSTKLQHSGIYGKNTQGENDNQDRYNIPNYQKNKFYLYGTSASIDDSHDDLCYAIKLPAGDLDETEIATFVFKNAIKYNGEIYNVRLAINGIKKTGDTSAVFEVRLGTRNTSDADRTDISTYRDGVLPIVAVQKGESVDVADYQIEADITYSIVNSEGTAIPISGVWGIGDIDKKGGSVIKDFTLSSTNTFIEQSANIANVKYKNSGGNAFLYSPNSEDTNNANVYVLINNKSSINTVKTWDSTNDASSYEMIDGLIGRYYNIKTKVTGGTITPSMNNVEENSSNTITYSANDATKQYLKSVKVDGTAVSTATYSNSYNFTNIRDDHRIEVVYANKLKVTFDLNGGTANPAIPVQYVNPNGVATQPTTVPTRNGYTFGGWTLNNSAYAFSTPVTSDITLVAKWTKISYHINYELDGGTNHADNPSEYTVEESVTFKSPTRDRYTFDAWYTTADRTTVIREIPVGSTGDKTIYAKWIPASGIEYKVQHFKMGTNGQYPSSPSFEETKTGTVGELVTAEPKNFAGYTEDTTYSGKVENGTIPDTGTLILKLYYKPIEYSITYVLNGGTNASTNPSKYTVESETITFDEATRSGYTFRGWYSNAELTTAMSEIPHGSTGNKKVYAKWEANTGVEYKVQHYLKKNGQYVLEETVTLAGSTGSTVIAMPKNYPGYEENTTAPDRYERDTIPETGTLTLRLYYDPIVYRINYVLDGGTNHADNPSTYTVDKIVTFKDPTKTGYTFRGWYEEAEFSNSIASTTNKVGNLTIYAKWTPNTGVAYKVEHRQKQNGEYVLVDTDNLTGTVNENVTATPKTYQGYVENTTATGRLAEGTIPASETLTLRLYYDPIEYRINYVLDGGINHAENPATYTVDKIVTFKAPTKTGYTFLGWYEEETFSTVITTTANKTGNLTIYAKWKPNSGIAYKVEHRQKQNGEYILVDTDNLTGTVNEDVNATPKTYPGYEENTTAPGRIARGTIPASETLTLKLYYDPIVYRINYVLDGGTNHADNPSTYTVDKIVTFKDPTKTGYTFRGWYEEAEFSNSIASTTNKVGNLTIYAKWTPNTGVAYKVEHYQKHNGEYTLVDTDNLTGTVNEEVTATPKIYQGYVENTTVTGRVAVGTIPASETLTLKLYYDPISYRINYILNGGTNHSDNPSTYTVDNNVVFKEPTQTGYTFLGWYEEAAFSTVITSTTNKTGDLIIYAKWEPRGDTGYKVEHYKKNTQGGYTLATTDSYTGTTGVTVTATPKEFKGYIENTSHSERVASGTISANGTLRLKLYYDPVIYNINYVLNKGTNDSRNPSTYTVDDNITIHPATRVGYNFKGWFEHPQFIGNATTTITDRAENITLYAKWEAKDANYTVEYYKQIDTGYELVISNTIPAKTDDEVSIELTNVDGDSNMNGETIFTGYVENKTHNDRVVSGIVKEDGSLVLRVYFDKIKYTVSFEPRNGTQINDQIVPYGELATKPTDPVKNGYTFKWWKLDETSYNFSTPVISDITLIAEWEPIKYQINYELYEGINHEDNPYEYTIEDTVEFKNPTKIGYIFDGWFTTAEKTEPITEIPAGNTGDRTIYAKWTPKSGIPYKVQHYKMQLDGEYPTTPSFEETNYGTVGTSVTAVLQEYDGYEEDTTYEERKEEGIIPATGELILKLYYKLIEYTIDYELNGGINDSSNPSKYTVETETITFAPATKVGYVFKDWYSDENFTSEMNEIPKGSTGNKKVYAKWEAASGVAYKVEHYKKNAKGEYELATIRQYTGTTEETVTAIPLEFKGYKENENHEDRVATGTIKADGSLVLKLYYDPISYNIDYVLNGGENNPQNPETYTVNDSITLYSATKEGYEFKGWYEDEEFKGKPTTTIIDRAENITLYARFYAIDGIEYKVEHYKETKNGEYELAVVKIFTGKTDKEVKAEPLEFKGYTENKSNANRIEKGTIKADGSLVLKLYYDKIIYTVSFNPQNGKKMDDQKVPYAEKATEPTKPTKDGYKFGYWYYEDENGGEVKFDFDTPIVSDLKLIAKWIVLEDNTKAPNTIPQTGEFNPIIAFSMVALVTLAGAFGIRYFKLNKIVK